MRDRKPLFICLLVFALCWIHGASLWLTDDEAYYWYISLRPAWGYANHPPVLEWILWLIQKITSPFFHVAVPAQVRLTSALLTGSILWFVLLWFAAAGISKDRIGRAALAFLCLPAIFGSSWMVVPDLPMFLGWMCALFGCWVICFGEAQPRHYWALGCGLAFGLLSKYTAILAVGSALACILMWLPRNRPQRLKPAMFAIVGGLVVALIPILIWNYIVHWAPFLYHFKDRHSGHVSLIRFMRFWLVETLIAGPVLIGYGWWRLGSGLRREVDRLRLNRFRDWGSEPQSLRVSRFILIWATPGALVFCLQPLIGDFKLHWPFVVWLPLAMEFAYRTADGKLRRAYWAQAAYGFSLIGFVLISCHTPWIGKSIRFFVGHVPDPKWDPTNDMYGWPELPSAVEKTIGPESRTLPILAGWHQVASQAAFAWGRTDGVAKIPHEDKERRDWPPIDAVSSVGPEWPVLLKPVMYIADNRFSVSPQFQKAQCSLIGEFPFKREDLLAKVFKVWKCVPEKEPAASLRQ